MFFFGFTIVELATMQTWNKNIQILDLNLKGSLEVVRKPIQFTFLHTSLIKAMWLWVICKINQQTCCHKEPRRHVLRKIIFYSPKINWYTQLWVQLQCRICLNYVSKQFCPDNAYTFEQDAQFKLIHIYHNKGRFNQFKWIKSPRRELPGRK